MTQTVYSEENLKVLLFYVIIPLIVINLLLGFLVPGIDNAAHIGGLIGGALMMIGVGVKYKSSNFERINGLIVSLIFLGFLIYMALFI